MPHQPARNVCALIGKAIACHNWVHEGVSADGARELRPIVHSPGSLSLRGYLHTNVPVVTPLHLQSRIVEPSPVGGEQNLFLKGHTVLVHVTVDQRVGHVDSHDSSAARPDQIDLAEAAQNKMAQQSRTCTFDGLCAVSCASLGGC
jgi:hypothetical protein